MCAGVEPPRGILLHGPPGCGKTLLAHAIAGELGVYFRKVSAPEIVSGMSGESEEKVRQIFEDAMTMAPSLIFIDEIDAIAPKRENAQRGMERRIVAQLLTCLDNLSLHSEPSNSTTDNNAPPAAVSAADTAETGAGTSAEQAEGQDQEAVLVGAVPGVSRGKRVTKPTGSRKSVIVIGATNRVDAIDPGLRRAGRFDREIGLGIPDETARVRILQVLTRRMRLAQVLPIDDSCKTGSGTGTGHVTGTGSSTSTGTAASRRHEDLAEAEEGDSNAQGFNFRAIARLTPGFVGADLHALTKEAAVLSVNRVFSKMLADGTFSNSQSAHQTAAITAGAGSGDADIMDCDDDTTTATPAPAPESAAMDTPASGKASLHTISQALQSSTLAPNKGGVKVQLESAPAERAHEAGWHLLPPALRAFQEVSHALRARGSLAASEMQGLAVTFQDFLDAIPKVQPSSTREGFATIPDVSWDDVGALKAVRDETQAYT